MKVETVIIGAGLSGLSCAIQLEKERRDYLLVEKTNRIGGRLGSIYEEDNIYDIGFQVFNTAYKNTMQLLDEDEVKLKMFKPGSVIHDGKSFNLISDPLRDPKRLFTSLFSSISTFKDKLKVLSLIAQLTKPVRWTQTIQQMIKDGASTFTEVGPGNVLQGLVRKIDRSVESLSLIHI